MMKTLNVYETITSKSGSFWWRDCEDHACGGERPSECNLTSGCYLYDGIIFNLITHTENGSSGGKCSWEVIEASQELSDLLKKKFPDKFEEKSHKMKCGYCQYTADVSEWEKAKSPDGWFCCPSCRLV